MHGSILPVSTQGNFWNKFSSSDPTLANCLNGIVQGLGKIEKNFPGFRAIVDARPPADHLRPIGERIHLDIISRNQDLYTFVQEACLSCCLASFYAILFKTKG